MVEDFGPDVGPLRDLPVPGIRSPDFDYGYAPGRLPSIRTRPAPHILFWSNQRQRAVQFRPEREGRTGEEVFASC